MRPILLSSIPESSSRGENQQCDICLNLKWDTQKVAPRVRLQKLGTSASDGCETCRILWEGLRKVTDGIPRLKKVVQGSGNWCTVRIYGGEGQLTQLNLQYPDKEWYEAGKSITLVFYMSLDSPVTWSSFRNAPEVPSFLTFPRCTEILHAWIRDCDQGHAICNSNKLPTRLPTRLLDLGSHNSNARLVETNGLNAQYTTLSYCWGGEKNTIKSTLATIAHHRKEIKFQDCPKTFQEAMAITRALGVRYLWIDALCIIQDDPSDWQKEAADMASVYLSSYLTIAAAHAAGPHQGCLTSEERRTYSPDSDEYYSLTPVEIPTLYENRPCSIFVRHSLFSVHALVSGWGIPYAVRDSPYLAQKVPQSPLLGRAWVLQESLLSPRTIYFHGEELHWECKGATRCECGWYDGREVEYTQGSTGNLKYRYYKVRESESEYAMREDMFRLWPVLISRYSSLKLSFESDRLPALAGIASLLSEQFKVTYLAGLWREDLPRALLWKKDILLRTTRVFPATAPTWSWASIQLHHHNERVPSAAISFEVAFQPDFVLDPNLKVLEAYCTTSTANAFGPVTEGRIRIRGGFIGAQLICDMDATTLANYVKPSGRRRRWINRDVSQPQGKDADRTPIEVYCILCGIYAPLSLGRKVPTQCTLVLEKCKSEPNVYKRVSFLDVEQEDGWFKDAEIAVFDIV